MPTMREGSFTTRLRRITALGARRLSRPVSHRFGLPLVNAVDQEVITKAGYFSQIGQDMLLDRHVFVGQRGGVFVDVGAHDGVTFNNTVFFERYRGWTGLCVEPNPEVFPRLQSARHATAVCAAVGRSEGTARFRIVEGQSMASGIEEAHRRRRKRHEAAQEGLYRFVEVPTRRLDSLLTEAGIDVVDLLSIDVEGGEASVLDSINLRRFRVRAAIVENNHRSWAVPRRMYLQGYQPVLRIGQDELYMPSPVSLC